MVGVKVEAGALQGVDEEGIPQGGEADKLENCSKIDREINVRSGACKADRNSPIVFPEEVCQEFSHKVGLEKDRDAWPGSQLHRSYIAIPFRQVLEENAQSRVAHR